MTRLAALIALIVLAVAPAAPAGTYDVMACGAATDRANLAWTYVETGAAGKLEYGDGCATGTGDFGGLWVRDTLNTGTTGNSNGDVSGFWRFDAPATTAITAISYTRYLRTYADDRFRSELRRADGSAPDSCAVTIDVDPCTRGGSGGLPASFPGLGTSRLEVGVRCASGSSSMFCINGTGIHRAQATLYGATVTVEDPLAPEVTPLSGSLFAGGWLRGTKTASMTANDATGIAEFDLKAGNRTLKTDVRACDERLPAPCASPGATVGSAWTGVDTSTLSDGTYDVVGVARDAGDNPTSTGTVQVRVDNTPPVGPVGLAGGPAWSSNPARNLSWSLPGGQAAPIESAQVTVCPAGSSNGCLTPAATTTASSLSLPTEGGWVAQVRLVDAAGNVTETPGSLPVGYDATPPPAPDLGSVEATGGSGYLVAVTPNDPGPAPIAGLQGEACPADGGACRPVGGRPDRASFELPSAGEWTIAIRTVDAAGNVSPSAVAEYRVTDPPTSSPSPDPSVTGTASPSPSPSPLARATPTLTLTKTRLSRRRLTVAGTLSANATGRIVITLKARKRTRKRTARVGPGGRFRRSFPLGRGQRGARRAKLTVRYGGNADFLPRQTSRKVSRARP